MNLKIVLMIFLKRPITYMDGIIWYCEQSLTNRGRISRHLKSIKELVELDDIDVSEDPVRRHELTLGFRILHGRKIFGLKYNDEIEAIVCIAFCPEVPFTVREMDYMSRVKDGRH